MKHPQDCHRDFFHQYQLKNTLARDRVYHLLEAHQPLTLDQLYQRLNKQPKTKAISHSTVFRMLEQFLKVGMIEKLHLDTENTPLYQLKDHGHHHHQLVCTQCKKIIPLEECPLDAFEKKMAKKHHFQLAHHQFTMYGVCQDCQWQSR